MNGRKNDIWGCCCLFVLMDGLVCWWMDGCIDGGVDESIIRPES